MRALKAALHKMLGERSSRFLEQLLHISSRQAERAGDAVKIEVRVAEVPCDLRQDRAQARSSQPALRHDLFGFGARAQRCGDEIEKVNADDRGQFGWRWSFDGCERSQVTVEQAERRSRIHSMTCQVLRMGYEGLKRGSTHRDIPHPTAAGPKCPLWASMVRKVRPPGITDTFLTGLRKADRASLDDVQSEVITAILKMMFPTHELG